MRNDPVAADLDEVLDAPDPLAFAEDVLEDDDPDDLDDDVSDLDADFESRPTRSAA